jgi:hypothetical protein
MVKEEENKDETIDRYTRLRPAKEYDGKSPARWFAVHIDEYSDQPKLIELQVLIGVQLSDRTCFAYAHEFSIKDLPCELMPITNRQPEPTVAELWLRKQQDRKRLRAWQAANKKPGPRLKPHQP